MVVLAKQVRKYVGNFCTKVTDAGSVYEVHFEIPNGNKKSIAALQSMGAITEDTGDSTVGYVDVSNDPSNVFGLELKKVAPRKKPKSERVIEKPKEVVEDIPKKIVDEYKDKVEKVVEETPQIPAKPEVVEEAIPMPVKDIPVKEEKPKEEKPKKRGFFSRRRK